ncbi:hypothetical protein COOONC_20168 [Cooperia oncophora]
MSLFVIVSMIMFGFLYDSPQYIMQKTGDPEQARKALAAYHGVDVSDSSIDTEIRICEEALTKEKSKKERSVNLYLNLKVGAHLAFQADLGVIDTEHSSLAILFMPWKARDPLSQVIRHGAWLGVMVKIAYVFTGARCIRAYTTFILYSMAGWSHKAALFESLMIGKRAIKNFSKALVRC